ncbi:MAG: hypothetical protein WAR41_04195 [Azonexus sp.]
MVTTASSPRPFFLPSGLGRIFAVYHAPNGDAEPWGNVLVVPAFNEEMNRCRSMVTVQAQALAQLGVGTLVIDLYGTGESDGEYGDARWDIWIENVRQGIEWLDVQPGGCTGLLGIRLGVALALSALHQDQKKRTLIAWQPVVDGKSCLTQFMRMRIAANMDRTDIPKDTTAGMRAQLAEGRSIEVAGYEIHPELATSIENLRLTELFPSESVSIAWQPIVDGKSCLTQFMRMRIAANMDRTDIPKDTTAGMRAQLAEGRSIEVAGYEIHPELAMSIESLRLSELIPPESVSIAWLEKGGGEENEISPASKCLLAAWQPAGRTTEVIPFDGPAFWALYERFLAPDLVKKTSDWVQLLRPTK